MMINQDQSRSSKINKDQSSIINHNPGWVFRGRLPGSECRLWLGQGCHSPSHYDDHRDGDDDDEAFVDDEYHYHESD